MKERITVRPYAWEGPYAEMRTAGGWEHDAGLCAEGRAGWMPEGERLILRTSEIVEYEGGYLYDDHFPPEEPEGRGKEYEHVSFQWDATRAPGALSARCEVRRKGAFWLELDAREDSINITLGIRNDLTVAMEEIDWHFCAVGYDVPAVGDAELERTFIHDGEKLRSLRELQGNAGVQMYQVAGAGGFIPAIHRSYKKGLVEAQGSVVIVQARDGRHSAALGFEQSYAIFSSPGNMCFHADPYFGLLDAGEQRTVRGKLYLVEGGAGEAWERYRAEFG